MRPAKTHPASVLARSANMSEIRYTDTALKQLRDMDRSSARRIIDYMDKRIARSANPRDSGKALSGPIKLWRYRIGDYRVICRIQEEKRLILAVRIGHRKNIYRMRLSALRPLRNGS
uniref:mRNA interferase RelE/StbE n=1 Tax=Candidatus Kentrum sp. LFY TaxID=2126342 RepID=A0A450V015_9GAMM|nr:MAG: mRNA interferase RelE/StbE [Candidatus Kentron sp. LFY]